MTSDKRFTILSFLIILLVNIVVFFPSFDQAPRGSDQYHYLVETSHIDTLSDRIVYSYSYPRIRKLASGDQILFRPIFYLLLSFETWLFRYNSAYWQAIALFLHMLVLWQIFKILKLVTRDPLPFFSVLLFSVLYVSQEMVTWHHVSGYMLFLIFFLQAFRLLITYYFAEKHEKKHLLSIILFFTLACFTIEIGTIYILVLFLTLLVYLWDNKQRNVKNPLVHAIHLINDRKLYILFIPIINYAALNFADYWATARSRGEPSSPFFGLLELSNIHLGSIFQKIWHMIYLGLGGVLFPCFSKMLPYSKTRFEGFSLHPGLMTNPPLQAINALLVIFIMALIVAQIFNTLKNTNCLQKQRIDQIPKRKNIISFISSVGITLLLVHIIFLTGGRSQTYHYITFSLYHFYILGVFALLSCSRFLRSFSENSSKVLIIILCAFIFLNGYQTHRFNQIRKALDGPWNHYIQQVSHFVERHKNEESFSFNIAWSQRRKAIGIYEGNPDLGKKYKGFFIDFLFRQYIDIQHPHYFLIYSDREGLHVFKDKSSAAEYIDSIKESIPTFLLPSLKKD